MYLPNHTSVRSNETPVKQTDLVRLWNALNTDVGQQIISYIETTVGRINLEQAKAFTNAEGEIAFVPIKSFSKVLAALCYRQLEDGSEYLFLITYNAAEKGVSFTFPSGRTFVMKSSGVKESLNPDFQFQQYDDLDNKVGITCNIFENYYIVRPGNCIVVALFFNFSINIPSYIVIWDIGYNNHAFCLLLIFSFCFCSFVPVYLYQNSNLEMISILFAVYYYGCILYLILHVLEVLTIGH